MIRIRNLSLSGTPNLDPSPQICISAHDKGPLHHLDRTMQIKVEKFLPVVYMMVDIDQYNKNFICSKLVDVYLFKYRYI